MDGTDLGWYLSSGGSSEGGAKSATPIVDATDNNVFADVSSAARIAGGTEIRKIFLENDHATDTIRGTAYERTPRPSTSPTGQPVREGGATAEGAWGRAWRDGTAARADRGAARHKEDRIHNRGGP